MSNGDGWVLHNGRASFGIFNQIDVGEEHFIAREVRRFMVLLAPSNIDETLAFGHLPQPCFLIVEPFKSKSIGCDVPQRIFTLP